MKKITLSVYFIAFIFNFCALAQNNKLDYPVVGQPCPNFSLTNVKDYHKDRISLEDFKGKWLILDFWSEGCVSCIKSFPKINEIQQEFSNEIQFLLVGIPNSRDSEAIQKLYSKHQQKLMLDIPIVFDTTLAQRFHVRTVPHLVVVDPNGVVKYITTMVNREEVQKIINNENPALLQAFNSIDVPPFADYDLHTPLLQYNNGGNEEDYYFRTVFTEANNLMPPGKSIFFKNQIEIINFGLEKFYCYALTGELSWHYPHNPLYNKVWRKLIFETENTALFQVGVEGQNTFAFSASAGEMYIKKFGADKIDFTGVLRGELERLLPFRVTLEKRLMPCNILSISEEKLEKIRSNADSLSFTWDGGKWQGFTAKKLPLTTLLGLLVVGTTNYEAKYGDVPLFFEGPEVEIDLKIASVYFDDRIKELEQLGFDLKQEKREMDVIVVRDKE